MEKSRMACNSSEERGNLTLSSAEEQVLELIRRLDYGKLVVTVKGGKPVFAEVQKTVPLQ